MNRPSHRALFVGLLLASMGTAFSLAGCKRGGGGAGGNSNTIVVDGSDTMVNLCQAWAEAYSKSNPGIKIQVSGGGSGVGINHLIDGTIHMATSSRKMTDSEVKRFKEKFTGKEPKEHVVGLDALAIYAHTSNPYDSISIEELAEIYGDGGKIEKWSQMGKTHSACPTDEIRRVSRQNSSGTYAYFREHVLGKGRDFKDGSINQSGSKDVVSLVGKTPCAIGYSGVGYRTAEVKLLKVSKKKGEPAIEPSEKTALDGTYPISRPLFIYTPGEPTGNLKAFIDWCKGPEGQKIVREVGYIPLEKK